VAYSARLCLALPDCEPLTAAKIIGEAAGVDRFEFRDAYARHNRTAPLPVWWSNRARHRLSRTGNRQLNAALDRIPLTKARWHPADRPSQLVAETLRALWRDGCPIYPGLEAE
jgi:transposase